MMKRLDQIESVDHPGWMDWFRRFGLRETGTDRGVRYQSARVALDAARMHVGFLVCGLSLVIRDLDSGALVTPFPVSRHIVAPHPYRLSLRADSGRRPQVQRFLAWLQAEAARTQEDLRQRTGTYFPVEERRLDSPHASSSASQ